MNPPKELLDIATETISSDAKNLNWSSKRVFHNACAPWNVPCHHEDKSSYTYVPLTGHKLSDGRVYVLGRCHVCGKIFWGETTKGF